MNFSRCSNYKLEREILECYTPSVDDLLDQRKCIGLKPMVFEREELRDSCRYPVGSYFVSNMPTIKSMVDNFRNTFQDELQGRRINFICSGSSGLIIATMFAQAFPDSCIMPITKPGERVHQSNRGYLVYRDGFNVIVDDHIEAGNTLQRIYSELYDKNGPMLIDCLVLGGRVKGAIINRIFNGNLKAVICGTYHY